MSWINLFPRATRTLLILMLAISAEAASFQDLINQKFTDQNSAVVIVSTDTGKIVGAAHADVLEKRYPPGSLIKVFTAIAFYEDHGNHFPVLHCPPSLASDPKGCWDRNGHGKVGIVEAIGHSCNVYFRQLAQKSSHDIFHKTLQKFDLAGSEPITDIHPVMVGNTLEWTVSPMMLIRAYSSLFNGGYLYPYVPPAARRQIPGKHIVLQDPIKKIIYQGMKLSSEQGTSLEAKRISGQSILGKTGTSLLWNDGKVNWRDTQGWWIGLYPADKPQIAVLTFVPSGRGATHAAPLGGKVISWFLQSR